MDSGHRLHGTSEHRRIVPRGDLVESKQQQTAAVTRIKEAIAFEIKRLKGAKPRIAIQSARCSEFDSDIREIAVGEPAEPQGHTAKLWRQHGIEINQVVRSIPPCRSKIVEETFSADQIIQVKSIRDRIVGPVLKLGPDIQFTGESTIDGLIAINVDAVPPAAQLACDVAAGIGVMTKVKTERGIHITDTRH